MSPLALATPLLRKKAGGFTELRSKYCIDLVPKTLKRPRLIALRYQPKAFLGFALENRPLDPQHLTGIRINPHALLPHVLDRPVGAANPVIELERLLP